MWGCYRRCEEDRREAEQASNIREQEFLHILDAH